MYDLNNDQDQHLSPCYCGFNNYKVLCPVTQTQHLSPCYCGFNNYKVFCPVTQTHHLSRATLLRIHWSENTIMCLSHFNHNCFHLENEVFYLKKIVSSTKTFPKNLLLQKDGRLIRMLSSFIYK